MKKYAVIKNSYRNILIIFIIVCLITGAFCFQYYNQLQMIIRGESSGYLQEVASRIGSNINRTINDNYSVLKTMSAVLKNVEADSFEDVRPVVEMQQSYWNYQDIMLIDEKGIAYNSTGKQILLSGDDYLREAILEDNPSMSTSQVIDGKECIIFAIPLEGMEIGGKKMGALAASYDPKVFEEILSMTSFNEQAYSQIINKDGTSVIRSTSQYAMKTGYNVLTSIEKSNLDAGVSMQKLRDDIRNDIAGQIGFTSDNVHKYMIYTPVNPEAWYLLTFVPVSVVNAKSDMLLSITLILCGLITFVFAGLISFLLLISFKNKKRLEQIAYVDDVTGGNTIQRFYELAAEAVSTPNHPTYALVFTNLEKFKVLNEQFGRSTCDFILKCFYQNILSTLEDKECIGRLFADNFCVLLKCEAESDLAIRFEEWYSNAERMIEEIKPIWSLPITEFGVYVIDNDSIPFTLMIDRAKLALKESAQTIKGRFRYAVYNDNVRSQLFRDKMLEDMMERALKNNEFQVYLQPKYRVSNETIGGAEALIRWASPTEGMIYPDEFIPLFESNGFIVQTDLWVFEEVCKVLRSWIDRGLEPVKTSVNCSRVHLTNADFLKQYEKILNKYAIPPALIELEFTESVVMEDTTKLSAIINELHSIGFYCSMDDFGSGYSSLNLIQDILVDTIKLDKIFFRNSSKDSNRMWSVVNSIVSLAKNLNMEIVAEGVEHREQVEILKKFKCDFIQGYVFAKPMPIKDFEFSAYGIVQEEEDICENI